MFENFDKIFNVCFDKSGKKIKEKFYSPEIQKVLFKF
jgi:hypothetical protein